MKISHEVPISLLGESITFNDYDYALVHLLPKYPTYYTFYKKSLLSGREVILDNSLFELGESFDSKVLASYVKELSPTYVIIPDSWGNLKETEKLWTEFTYDVGETKKIGVVQGSTLEELIECYRFMSNKADMIALTFGLPVYKTFDFSSFSEDEKLMKGRAYFIKYLKNNNLWTDKPHHLLGCALPQEVLYYKGDMAKGIRSMDTSSPIMAGINNIYYNRENVGLKEKPKGLLASHILDTLSLDQLKAIRYNISMFKEMMK